MKLSELHLLTGREAINEIAICDNDEQSPCLNKGDMKLECIAVEIREEEKAESAYGTIINDFSNAEFLGEQRKC